MSGSGGGFSPGGEGSGYERPPLMPQLPQSHGRDAEEHLIIPAVYAANGPPYAAFDGGNGAPGVFRGGVDPRADDAHANAFRAPFTAKRGTSSRAPTPSSDAGDDKPPVSAPAPPVGGEPPARSALRSRPNFFLVLLAAFVLGGFFLHSLSTRARRNVAATAAGAAAANLAGGGEGAVVGGGLSGAGGILDAAFFERSTHRLSYNRRNFTLDGKELRLLSGSVHYFRTLPEYWPIVLRKVKAAGLNTVETLVPWSMHEPEPGHFVFGGALNVSQFLLECRHAGLMVVLRLGPHVGAQLDFGGLPGWLLYDNATRVSVQAHSEVLGKSPRRRRPSLSARPRGAASDKAVRMRPRSMNAPFLQRVERYFEALAEQLEPFASGRPLMGFQLESKLGSLQRDDAYMAYLRGWWMERRAFRSMMFVSCDDSDGLGRASDVAGVLRAVAFNAAPVEQLRALRRVQRSGPMLAMELRTAEHADLWGESAHRTRVGDDLADTVADVLRLGASLNLYMFFGGTTWALHAGAQLDAHSAEFRPIVGSHDYDAVVTESSNVKRAKFEPLVGVLAASGLTRVPRVFEEYVVRFDDYGAEHELPLYAPLLELLHTASPYPAVDAEQPMPMERIYGQSMGFVLYRHMVRAGELGNASADAGTQVTVRFQRVHDRAYVIADGSTVAIVERNERSLHASVPRSTRVLDVLVESLGRLPYGARGAAAPAAARPLPDYKGLLGDVRADGVALRGWRHYRLSLENDHPLWPDPLRRRSVRAVSDLLAARQLTVGNWRTPMFFCGSFDAPEVHGGRLPCTYLKLEGHGMAWLNGFPLGRFWGYRGPQETLFVPAALLRPGKNRVLVLQLEPHRFSGRMYLSADPLLGEPTAFDSRRQTR